MYRALNELASAQVTAKPTRFYPITLKDLRPWFLNNVLLPCVTDILQKSLVFLGKAGKGKSVVAFALSMAVSLYHIIADEVEGVEPGFRKAEDMDFFRKVYVSSPCVWCSYV